MCPMPALVGAVIANLGRFVASEPLKTLMTDRKDIAFC